jgi:hypothetical protein
MGNLAIWILENFALEIGGFREATFFNKNHFVRSFNMKKILGVSLVSMACCAGVSVQAGENCNGFTAEMSCFDNGNVADANQVNANFQALLNRITQLEAVNQSLSASIQTLINGGGGTSPSDKPDYDSGWFAVVTPASNQIMTIQHNLNAFPTRYWIWFSRDNPPSQVYPLGRGQSPNYNTAVGWGQPHSIAFTENEMIYTLLGQTPIGRYYNHTNWETWQSGYWRILLWK